MMDYIKHTKKDEKLAPDWRRQSAVVDGKQLWSTSPAVILVQPRLNSESLDFTDTFRHYRETLTLRNVHDEIDETRFMNKKKNSSVRLMRISPNFASFLHSEDEATRGLTSERARGGYRTYPRVVEDDDLLKLRSGLKKPWKFEDIIKDIESDSFRVTTPPNDFLTPQPITPERFTSDDVFIEIPLQGSNREEIEVENPKEQERKNIESKEALSKLFDQLLADVYNQRLTPPSGIWSLDEPRRCSETKLVEIRRWEGKRIFRQMSFPGHDASGGKRNLDVNQLKMPVRSLSGINQSRPGVEEFVNLNSLNTGVDLSHRHQQTTVEKLSVEELEAMDVSDIEEIRGCLEKEISFAGACLVEELKEKDALVSDQEGLCEIVTAYLHAISTKTSEDARVQFSLSPAATDSSGFQEWARAMRMVARLPDGVPAHFRKNLWLSLAERHLNSKGVVWNQIERRLFSDTNSPEDKELSVQIVKDLHRTGCSLFCGVTGQHNQAVLKRVLVAYARWNKNVGYCQGLNMLAAIILQVMQGSQSATVKVMIYLIEGVLPESYFANNLRGLSVDMAVFRDLLRLKLPKLSKHLDHLQQDSKDSGTSYEPPLCDVFTMQWFLTLFSNCLPQSTVLRVWDLVFLEGDHVLLKTSLAIWQCLSDRLVGVRSADEFYSIMAVMTREMMEFGLMEPNNLIKAIDNMAVPEVPELREKYIYNISPWAVGTVAKMGVKLLYPDVTSPGTEDCKESKTTPFSNHPDREKIALDISALKRQYWKLRERQRQAHIILTACRSETLTANNSPALNHLLLGKRALLSAKGRRIEGAIPQPMNKSSQAKGRPAVVEQTRTDGQMKESGTTIHWRQTRSRRGGTSRSPTPSSASSSASSSSSTELCDSSSDSEENLPLEETGAGVSNNDYVENETTNEKAERSDDQEEDLKTGKASPDIKKALDDEKNSEKRQSEMALLQILQENSEILQRIHKSHDRSNSGSGPEMNEAGVAGSRGAQGGRRDSNSLNQSPDEPDDIKDIRRRYAVRQTSSLDSPNPTRLNNRNVDGSKTNLFTQAPPSVSTPSSPVFKPFPTTKSKHPDASVKLGLYASKSST